MEDWMNALPTEKTETVAAFSDEDIREIEAAIQKVKIFIGLLLAVAAGVWLQHQYLAMNHPALPDRPAPEVVDMPVMGSEKPAVTIMQCWKEEDAAVRDADVREEMMYDDLELLAMCVEAEAGNQSLTGKRMVADVVLNRVDDKDWPDTVGEVIRQKNQFSTWSDGAMERAEPSEETYRAVRMELEERGWPGIYYFTAEGFSKYGTPWRKVGDHYFSKK